MPRIRPPASATAEEVLGRKFGLSANSSAATNTTALTNALTELRSSTGPGATLRLPPGTLQLNDEVALGLLIGKRIVGSGMRGTTLQQTTTNKAALLLDQDGTSYNSFENFTIAHASSQAAANTNAYGVAITITGSTTQGVFRNVWDGIRIDNFFRGMGQRKASGYATWWGDTFRHLNIHDCTGASIYIKNPTAVGQPEWTWENVYCQNYGTTNTEAMVILEGVELDCLVLGIEDGENDGLQLIGNEGVRIGALHAERHVFTTTNKRLIETSTGPLEIGYLRFMGTENSGGDNYLVVPGAYVRARTIHTEVMNTSGTLHLVASGTGRFVYDRWRRESGTVVDYPSWDTSGGPSDSGAQDLFAGAEASVLKRWAGSSAVANTAAETTFTPHATIAANDLRLNQVFRVRASGVYGTTGTPNLTLKLKYGSTVLASTSAVATASGVTNRGWSVDCTVTVVSLGASGSVECQGWATLGTAAGTAVQQDMENTAAVTVDTTAAANLQVSAEWGTANASNTITCRQMTVRRL